MLFDDVILYNLNNYLNINDKCNLKLVNKYFYKIESRAINFHLGTFISNYLGIDNKCDEELEILQIYRFEILDEISNFLFKEKIFTRRKKSFINNYIPVGIIHKIYSSSLESRKQKLKEKLIFGKKELDTKYNNKICYDKSYSLKKKFINVYAII